MSTSRRVGRAGAVGRSNSVHSVDSEGLRLLGTGDVLTGPEQTRYGSPFSPGAPVRQSALKKRSASSPARTSYGRTGAGVADGHHGAGLAGPGVQVAERKRVGGRLRPGHEGEQGRRGGRGREDPA